MDPATPDWRRPDHASRRADVSQPQTSTRKPRASRVVPWILSGLGIGLAFLFVALLAFGVNAQSPNASIDASLGRGQPAAAPPFHLAVLQSGRLGPILARRLGGALQRPTISLSDVRGVPLVLNFYASWCVTCQAEASTLEHAWRQQARPRGVLLLGLDMQDATTDAHAYMRHYNVDYPSVRDPTNQVATTYGVTGLPETFFIDARGQIVGHIIGISTAAQLSSGIGSALAGRVGDTGTGGAQRPLR